MAVTDPTLLRAAGVSALVAILALIVSGITIALFFGCAGAFWGPVNDLATAVALLALVLPVMGVQRLARAEAGAWLDVVTLAALAGIVVAAAAGVWIWSGIHPKDSQTKSPDRPGAGAPAGAAVAGAGRAAGARDSVGELRSGSGEFAMELAAMNESDGWK